MKQYEVNLGLMGEDATGNQSLVDHQEGMVNQFWNVWSYERTPGGDIELLDDIDFPFDQHDEAVAKALELVEQYGLESYGEL
jgi:hypothetical protein